MANNIHITPSHDAWQIKRAGGQRASAKFKTQAEAIQKATAMARSDSSELFIHGRNGRIRERNTFGNDPYPPQG